MGRTVIITGTNRGIGSAILKRFAEEEDITILAHARKETEEFLTMLCMLEKEKRCSVEPVYFDLGDPEQIKKELSGVIRRHRRIDVLVNNAAVVKPPQAFLMADMAMIRESFEINFFAWVQITQIICRAMIRNGSGAIVNMSSVAAFSGVEGQFEYTAAKAAVVGMTRRLATELAPYRIRCNAVAPGMTDTDMIRQMEPQLLGRLIDRSISRRLGKPEEIADVVFFLAGGQASYVNGQTILVNGGV